ncbi:flagellar hook-length control protein FliK [Pseudoalteromonas phenolica]|uniref:flagellar hook-length control protein FliK n=1 Tax=Pseudoalteromonas phenolica TaxID=161398 RepID=UPI00110A9406|nr:flagellar hook-length control protein FliK [Pseudoalteromonas phenolica]TMO57502.1 hypothetical protein CWC21_02920 [Pseudoalteromonas phenolica]
MLNLNLEVDLKLSQAEKARFASEKEQADKSAFYSELERAEKTSARNSDIEQQIHSEDKKSFSSPKQESPQGDKTYKGDEVDAVDTQGSEPKPSLNNHLEQSNSSTNSAQGNQDLNQLSTTEGANNDVNTYLHHGSVGVSDNSQSQNAPEKVSDESEVKNINEPRQNVQQNTTFSTQTSAYSNPQAEPSTSDKLLAQIQASNSQTTDVKQHLAPVPKALKDVFSQFDGSKEKVPTELEKKIDKISPPGLGHGEGETMKATSSKSDLVSMLNEQKAVVSVANNEAKEKDGTSSKAVIASNLPQESQSSRKEAKQSESNELELVKTNTLSGKSVEGLSEPMKAQKNKGDNQLNNALVQDAMTVSDKKSALVPNSEKVDSSVTHKPTERNVKQTSTDLDTGLNASSSQPKQLLKESKDDNVTISNEAKIATHLDKTSEPQKSTTMTHDKMANLTDKSGSIQGGLEQQIKSLSNEEKRVLQQSLQQAIDSGKLDDVQLKRAEEALTIFKSNQELKTQDNQKPELKSNNALTNTANQTKPTVDSVNYNSTKVTSQSLSEAAQASIEQSKHEQVSTVDASEVIQANHGQFDKSVRKAEMSSQTENIFKSIIQQPQSVNVQSTHDLDISQSMQQFDSALHTAQTQQNSPVAQKANLDSNLTQAFNLQKNDAVKALHDKVNAMLTINNKEAEIRLDPPELGSMQIRIRSEAEQAQVNFVVQNQQAKEALEQSMPKLKEMLAEQGIQLGESNIQQDSGSRSEQGTDEAQELGHSKLANQEPQAQNSEQTRTNSTSSESGIDYYA